MYAIVKISGKQWKVEPQNRISVDKLPYKKDEIFYDCVHTLCFKIIISL